MGRREKMRRYRQQQPAHRNAAGGRRRTEGTAASRDALSIPGAEAAPEPPPDGPHRWEITAEENRSEMPTGRSGAGRFLRTAFLLGVPSCPPGVSGGGVGPKEVSEKRLNGDVLSDTGESGRGVRQRTERRGEMG